MLLADLHVGILVGAGIAQRNLSRRVGHLSVGNHFKILEYLDIPFVRVHDYVEVLVGTEHLSQNISE